MKLPTERGFPPHAATRPAIMNPEKLTMPVRALFGLAGWVCLCQLTACGLYQYGQKQEITVATINDRMPEHTRCLLRNEEGLWKVKPNTLAMIHRDGNDLEVQCINANQSGNTQVQTEFNADILILDLLGFCVGCPVDGYFNTWFKYPPIVTVLMKERKENDFINPLLQP